jgi:hypothetical protein
MAAVSPSIDSKASNHRTPWQIDSTLQIIRGWFITSVLMMDQFVTISPYAILPYVFTNFSFPVSLFVIC